MSHYTSEFSTKCFKDSQAQDLIISYNGIKLDHLTPQQNEHVDFTNDESIIANKVSYLISFCSSYLSLQQGNYRAIQLYYSHQFCKQFG